MMTPTQLRQSFVDFFSSRQHTHVPSSSLIPDDPTLPFFVNAGMNQFVPFFLGRETPPFSPGRAANSQKCIRAGGKHNDLEDVGFDTYHHTFFEMLGNWSFGDYFKREAILWCWELLTEQWGFPKDRLYFTVYKPEDGEPGDTDMEAYNIWKEVCVNAGLDPDIHIIFAGKRDNFWMMGDTGPCGPCSEVHIDLTAAGDTKGELVNADDHRCIEIWNLVFIQNNATPDGRFEDLPAKHVDTGMGFERACAAMQCTKNFTDFSGPAVSNYNTDIFKPIFDAITDLTGKTYQSTMPTPGEEPKGQIAVDIAFRVIGDHVRCLTASIADGIYPDKTGRGYVMRRILRRAVRYGRTLDLHGPFLCKLAEVVIEQLGPIFPSITENQAKVIQYLRAEEESFGRTLDRGLDLFAAVRKKVEDAGETTINGADAFELYDTYGFPLDLTELMAREINLTVDVDGFNAAMEQQRKRGRDAREATVVIVEDGDLELGNTEFTGFDNLRGPAMVQQVIPVDDGFGVVLDKSPFYVEMGGQVGDSGVLRRGDEIIQVRDTQKMAGGIVHLIDGAANLSKGDVVDAAVDAERRCAIERHHTVTHLLHWALREVVGKDSSQRGSFVGPDYLRFDFNHHSGLTKEEVAAVEDLVNQRIMENAPVYWTEQDRESIRGNSEINQFFGDKYGDSVRVVQIGGEKGALNGYSMELCGGTHTSATGIIGPFVLRHEAAISAGIRRIEAIAGSPARAHVNAQLALLDRIGSTVGSPIADLEKRIETMIETQKRLEKELKAASAKLAQSAAGDLISQVEEIGGVPALVADVSSLDASPAELLESLQQKFQDGIIVLGGASNGACSFACAVPNDLVKQGHNAGTLAREAAKVTGGGGGGSPQKAKAGGRDASKLADALQKAREVIAG